MNKIEEMRHNMTAAGVYSREDILLLAAIMICAAQNQENIMMSQFLH